MALSAKRLTVILVVTASLSALGVLWEAYRIRQIEEFNQAVTHGRIPATDTQSFEARFSTAYWLARNGRYQDSTLLFLQLLEHATPVQKSAVQYDLGNIFFLRALIINGRDMTVKNTAAFLFTQAKNAYIQSLKLDNSFWDARHNLDRILMILPDDPSPGVGNSDSPGLIMGNIPVGLP